MKYKTCVIIKALKSFAASQLTPCSPNAAQGRSASLSNSVIAKSFSAAVLSHAAPAQSWITINRMVDPFRNTSANDNLSVSIWCPSALQPYIHISFMRVWRCEYLGQQGSAQQDNSFKLYTHQLYPKLISGLSLAWICMLTWSWHEPAKS